MRNRDYERGEFPYFCVEAAEWIVGVTSKRGITRIHQSEGAVSLPGHRNLPRREARHRSLKMMRIGSRLSWSLHLVLESQLLLGSASRNALKVYGKWIAAANPL